MGKAEKLVKAHQEYQRGLHAFEDWLEQEQEKLGCYTQLEGDVDMLEETLQRLQVSKNYLLHVFSTSYGRFHLMAICLSIFLPALRSCSCTAQRARLCSTLCSSPERWSSH